MNPYEYIEEMKESLRKEIKEKDIKPDDCITQKEHYARMTSMLNIIAKELKNAEYNYVVQSVNGKTIHTFDELMVTEKQLNDDVIIFQPIEIEYSTTQSDMESLAQALTKLRDDGNITANMLLLPPNINIFKAKLASSGKEDCGSLED